MSSDKQKKLKEILFKMIEDDNIKNNIINKSNKCNICNTKYPCYCTDVPLKDLDYYLDSNKKNNNNIKISYVEDNIYLPGTVINNSHSDDSISEIYEEVSTDEEDNIEYDNEYSYFDDISSEDTFDIYRDDGYILITDSDDESYNCFFSNINFMEQEFDDIIIEDLMLVYETDNMLKNVTSLVC